MRNMFLLPFLYIKLEQKQQISNIKELQIFGNNLPIEALFLGSNTIIIIIILFCLYNIISITGLLSRM